MANEIQVTYNGADADLYALARLTSDVTVWAAAWVAWVDADIDDYDIVLTDQGGGLYTATFPAAIAAQSEIHLQIRRRSGATPALTDYVLDARTLIWTGSKLISSTKLVNLVIGGADIGVE